MSGSGQATCECWGSVGPRDSKVEFNQYYTQIWRRAKEEEEGATTEVATEKQEGKGSSDIGSERKEEEEEELQVEVEKVAGIIQHVHQKVHDIATPMERVMPEQVSFDLVEQLQKKEEEVRVEA